jgi:hypothetical protein
MLHITSYQKKIVKYAAFIFVDDETKVNEWLESNDDENSKGKSAIQGTLP